MDEPEGFWWSVGAHVIQILLTAAFGLWAWVVKHFGDQSIAGIKVLSADMAEMKHQVFVNSERLSRLEGRMEIDDRFK